MSRIMAIDVGTKTLGLALSDESGRVSMPLETLSRTGMRRDIERIATIVREREIAEIVVGLPLDLDGSPGELEPEARAIAGRLGEACRLPVHLWDERLTTAAAERVLLQADVSRRKRRRVIDKLAATLILQSFLDRRLIDRSGETA